MDKESELRSVSGVVDGAAFAAYLGTTPEQLRLWLHRKLSSDDPQPLPALFPLPIGNADGGALGGKVNGGNVWTRGSVITFGRELVLHEQRGGRTPARLKDKP